MVFAAIISAQKFNEIDRMSAHDARYFVWSRFHHTCDLYHSTSKHQLHFHEATTLLPPNCSVGQMNVRHFLRVVCQMSRSGERLIFSRDAKGNFRCSVPTSVQVVFPELFHVFSSAELHAGLSFESPSRLTRIRAPLFTAIHELNLFVFGRQLKLCAHHVSQAATDLRVSRSNPTRSFLKSRNLRFQIVHHWNRFVFRHHSRLLVPIVSLAVHHLKLSLSNHGQGFHKSSSGVPFDQSAFHAMLRPSVNYVLRCVTNCERLHSTHWHDFDFYSQFRNMISLPCSIDVVESRTPRALNSLPLGCSILSIRFALWLWIKQSGSFVACFADVVLVGLKSHHWKDSAQVRRLVTPLLGPN
jgi:hypothetical protein